jgi:hypothetical protein
VKTCWWQRVLIGLAAIPLAGFLVSACAEVWYIFSGTTLSVIERVGDYLTGFYLLVMLETLIGALIAAYRECRGAS